MSTSSYLSLPESERFNGRNFQTFKIILETTITGKGLSGYLDGTIARPADSFTAQNAVISITTTPAPTSASTTGTTAQTSRTTTTTRSNEPLTQWNSMKPYLEEWIRRDAYVCSSILLNVVNPSGLGVVMSGSVADMWKSIVDRYGMVSIIGAINARVKLESTKLTDGEDMESHLQKMRLLWKEANDEGANITDTAYRTILVSSLPITLSLPT